jgi:hypothetical protein
MYNTAGLDLEIWRTLQKWLRNIDNTAQSDSENMEQHFRIELRNMNNTAKLVLKIGAAEVLIIDHYCINRVGCPTLRI